MIYLDNAATTIPDPSVVDTYCRAASDFFGNSGSLHHYGLRASALIEQAREQILKLFDAESFNLTFTGSATEANNLAIRSIAKLFCDRGRHIVSSQMEHPSIYETLKSLQKEGWEVDFVAPDSSGVIRAEAVGELLREDTVLVSLMSVNNETGAITDIEEVSRVVKSRSNAKIHCDAVQSAGKLPISLKQMGVDLLTVSPHKFNGLKGSGVLISRKNIHLPPQITGGGQEGGRRSGTPDTAGVAAAAKATRLSVERIPEALKIANELSQYLREELSRFQRVTLNTPRKSSPYITNISVRGIKPETLLHQLEEYDIYISTISACSAGTKGESRPVKIATGDSARAGSSVRISLSYNTKKEDIESFLQRFSTIIQRIDNGQL